MCIQSPESVPLTLYANGMVLFSGPFRKYSEPLTQEFLLDVIDGYYPSELQERYPDGVAFQVNIFKNNFCVVGKIFVEM